MKSNSRRSSIFRIAIGAVLVLVAGAFGEARAQTPTATPTPSCAATPIAGCRTPAVGQKALLLLKKPDDDNKEKLIWKWTKGAATSKADFGDPLGDTSYLLCMYDGSSTLVLESFAEGGDTCEGNVPCWSEKPTGFKYKDKDNSPNGPQQILLKAGLAGKAKIIVKGRGSDLDVPPLPLAQPVTVQLVNTDGVCWEAVYSAPAIKNEGGPKGKFKDKAD
jgi:hypothetical protein